LETILKVVPVPLENAEYGDFIKFEAVTLVPFEPKLILVDDLLPEEREWLNNYNQLIIDHVVPRVESVGDTRTLEWILERTSI